MFRNLFKNTSNLLLNSTVPKKSFGKTTKKPVRVAVTGAAGNIGYALVFRIANGDLLGKDQPVILHLIDLPPMETSLTGV
jgi:hypothetical protein